MNKKITLGIGLVLLMVFSISGCSLNQINTPPSNTTTNSVTNTEANDNSVSNSNENTNQIDVSAQTDAIYIGKVFLKGYKTPSESYGILTDDGSEIGFGKYDSMKEQFRAYIGDRVKVKFANICRSSHDDCCRTLFPFCGTVESWEPLN